MTSEFLRVRVLLNAVMRLVVVAWKVFTLLVRREHTIRALFVRKTVIALENLERSEVKTQSTSVRSARLSSGEAVLETTS